MRSCSCARSPVAATARRSSSRPQRSAAAVCRRPPPTAARRQAGVRADCSCEQLRQLRGQPPTALAASRRSARLNNNTVLQPIGAPGFCGSQPHAAGPHQPGDLPVQVRTTAQTRDFACTCSAAALPRGCSRGARGWQQRQQQALSTPPTPSPHRLAKMSFGQRSRSAYLSELQRSPTFHLLLRE